MQQALWNQTGLGTPSMQALPMGPNYSGQPPTIDYIEEGITEFQDAHRDLFRRMDADYDLWMLKSYNTNKDGTDTFPSYTSNAPRTFAQKVVSLVNSAKLLIKVPYDDAVQQERIRYDAKERLLYGLLNAADERLVRRVEPRLKAQMAWYATVRGFIMQRAVLVKRPMGGVYVDVTPWDARRACWRIGPEGLTWAALTAKRTGTQIKDEYGMEVGAGTEQYELVDYYDMQYNAVFVKGFGWVKPPTPHGARRVPVVLVPIGAMPHVQSEADSKAMAQFGESVFAADRALYPVQNEAVSIHMALMQKARDRSYVLKSPSGSKTLDDNPNEAAGIIPLATQDELELVALAETTKDSAIFEGVVGAEIQQGALPRSSYGDINFTLSGFAINSLHQSIFSTLQPVIDGMQDGYSQTLLLLGDQYESGMFDPFAVSGRDNGRHYFNAMIQPQEVAGLPTAEVTLAAELPQDDIAKIQMAQAARQGAVPLLPDVDILERIVGIGDVGVIQDAIKEQMAERATPLAQAYTLMMAAANRGQPELAKIYLAEIQMQQLLQLAHLAQAQMAEITAQAQVQQIQMGAPPTRAQPPGPGPSQLPPQMAGMPQPKPSPAQIPNRPPGTARPGNKPPPVGGPPALPTPTP